MTKKMVKMMVKKGFPYLAGAAVAGFGIAVFMKAMDFIEDRAGEEEENDFFDEDDDDAFCFDDDWSDEFSCPDDELFSETDSNADKKQVKEEETDLDDLDKQLDAFFSAEFEKEKKSDEAEEENTKDTKEASVLKNMFEVKEEVRPLKGDFADLDE